QLVSDATASDRLRGFGCGVHRLDKIEGPPRHPATFFGTGFQNAQSYAPAVNVRRTRLPFLCTRPCVLPAPIGTDRDPDPSCAYLHDLGAVRRVQDAPAAALADAFEATPFVRGENLIVAQLSQRRMGVLCPRRRLRCIWLAAIGNALAIEPQINCLRI